MLWISVRHLNYIPFRLVVLNLVFFSHFSDLWKTPALLLMQLRGNSRYFTPFFLFWLPLTLTEYIDHSLYDVAADHETVCNWIFQNDWLVIPKNYTQLTQLVKVGKNFRDTINNNGYLCTNGSQKNTNSQTVAEVLEDIQYWLFSSIFSSNSWIMMCLGLQKS